MKVEKLRVYRIVPFEEPVNVGESAYPHEWYKEEEYKRQIESALELHRPKEYPPRENAYMCAFPWIM